MPPRHRRLPPGNGTAEPCAWAAGRRITRPLPSPHRRGGHGPRAARAELGVKRPARTPPARPRTRLARCPAQAGRSGTRQPYRHGRPALTLTMRGKAAGTRARRGLGPRMPGRTIPRLRHRDAPGNGAAPARRTPGGRLRSRCSPPRRKWRRAGATRASAHPPTRCRRALSLARARSSLTARASHFTCTPPITRACRGAPDSAHSSGRRWYCRTVLTGPWRVRASRQRWQMTLGTVRRADGQLQETYSSWPLYLWIGDTAPGQADDMGLWYTAPITGAVDKGTPRG